MLHEKNWQRGSHNEIITFDEMLSGMLSKANIPKGLKQANIIKEFVSDCLSLPVSELLVCGDS